MFEVILVSIFWDLEMGSEIYYGGIHMGDANWEKYGSFFGI